LRDERLGRRQTVRELGERRFVPSSEEQVVVVGERLGGGAADPSVRAGDEHGGAVVAGGGMLGRHGSESVTAPAGAADCPRRGGGPNAGRVRAWRDGDDRSEQELAARRGADRPRALAGPQRRLLAALARPGARVRAAVGPVHGPEQLAAGESLAGPALSAAVDRVHAHTGRARGAAAGADSGLAPPGAARSGAGSGPAAAGPAQRGAADRGHRAAGSRDLLPGPAARRHRRGDPGGAGCALVDRAGAGAARGEERRAGGGDRGGLPVPAARAARLVGPSDHRGLRPAARGVPHLPGPRPGPREPGDGAGVRRVVSPHPAHHAAGDRPHPAGHVRLRGLRAAAERDLHLRPASPGGLTRSEDVGLAVAVGDDRQAGLEPLVHAAADVDRLEAVGVEPLADLEAAAAGAADDVHRVVGLGELVEVLHQRARREVLGVLGVAGVPFVLLAHVDEVRALGDGGRSDGLGIHGASLTAVSGAREGPRESRRARADGRPAREGTGRPPAVRTAAQAARTASRRTSGEATSTAAITSAYAAITLTRYCTAASGSLGAPPNTAEITISAVPVARIELSTTGTAISAIRARCS